VVVAGVTVAKLQVLILGVVEKEIKLTLNGMFFKLLVHFFFV